MRHLCALRDLCVKSFDEEMRVDAAEAEPAHSGASRSGGVALLPGLSALEEPEGPRDAGRGPLEVRLRRQSLVPESEERLREPRGAGAGEEVTDARLDRSEDALAGAPARGA